MGKGETSGLRAHGDCQAVSVCASACALRVCDVKRHSPDLIPELTAAETQEATIMNMSRGVANVYSFAKGTGGSDGLAPSFSGCAMEGGVERTAEK